MKEEIEPIEILGGNTKIPPKSQSTQCIHWCFTFNNYIEEDIETIETLFKHLAFKYCFQEETGENGTKHLQGVVSLKKKMRWTEFGLSKTIHWEKVKSLTQAYLYCCKNDTRTGRIFNMNYKIPKPLKLINPKDFYEWEHEIIDIISREPDERKVYWYWSEEGNMGKSSFAKYLVAKHDAIFFEEGKKADIMKLVFDADMDQKDTIVVDIPRDNGNNVSYKSIESIKNGMIYSSKYEGGYKLFNSPHLIIFCNSPPDEHRLSKDRWVIKQI